MNALLAQEERPSTAKEVSRVWSCPEGFTADRLCLGMSVLLLIALFGESCCYVTGTPGMDWSESENGAGRRSAATRLASRAAANEVRDS